VTTLALSSADLATLAGDVLVVATVPAGGRRKGAVLAGPATALKAAPRKKLEEALAALGATGKAGDVVTVPGAGIVAAPVVLAVGLGAEPHTDEALRRAAGNATRAAAGHKRAILALPTPTPSALDAVAQGAALGAYTYDEYRHASKAAQKSAVTRVTLHVRDAKDAETVAALARARAVTTAVGLARDLVNTPPSDLVPSMFADAALEAVADLPIEVEVLDDAALEAGGYGGLMGVGRGSAHGPRLVRLAYRPADASSHLSIVGKGITFDTGGISIKPSLNMHEMKGDMGGAAATLGAVKAIATLGLPVAVTGWLCLAENMPSGTAQKPGDVIRTYGGRTIEVLNTDAEGRLVMADVLVRAQEESPDVLVDVATLTGAAIVALGARTFGIMANDDDLREAVHDAATRAGETSWPMPLPEELRANLDSPVADIANIPYVGMGQGGMLSAGAFLKDFISDGQRWAHLDIAGPSWNAGAPHGYTPKGGTGVAVRTLLQLAEDLADSAV
jgi:leucyl aminopeptidase